VQNKSRVGALLVLTGAAAALALARCGGDDENPPDGAGGAAGQSANDAAADTVAQDVIAKDTSPERINEATVDSPAVDVASEDVVPTDTRSELAEDVVATDVVPDAPPEAAPETGVDVNPPDALPDTTTDVAVTDAAEDVALEASADAAPEADSAADPCSDLGGHLGWMCPVGAGSLQMGCNSAVDSDCAYGEDPYHAVTVPAFLIDKYEVTAAQYKACVDASVCTAPAVSCTDSTYDVSGKENRPINCVSWVRADQYCTWAGKRLPTEAEWERASRSDDGRKYPWGNTPAADCSHAVMYSGGWGCGTGGPMDVGSKPPGTSPFGAMDMVGNVSEWVADDWHDSFTAAPTDGSAWLESPRSDNRVIKGGSWGHSLLSMLRCSTRYYATSNNQGNAIGMRCAKAP
jgi:formylglycine-generating enzyme